MNYLDGPTLTEENTGIVVDTIIVNVAGECTKERFEEYIGIIKDYAELYQTVSIRLIDFSYKYYESVDESLFGTICINYAFDPYDGFYNPYEERSNIKNIDSKLKEDIESVSADFFKVNVDINNEDSYPSFSNTTIEELTTQIKKSSEMFLDSFLEHMKIIERKIKRVFARCLSIFCLAKSQNENWNQLDDIIRESVEKYGKSKIRILDINNADLIDATDTRILFKIITFSILGTDASNSELLDTHLLYTMKQTIINLEYLKSENFDIVCSYEKDDLFSFKPKERKNFLKSIKPIAMEMRKEFMEENELTIDINGTISQNRNNSTN